MFIRRSHFGVVVAALLLSGCSVFDSTADSVWSSLSGEDSDTSANPPSDSGKDNAGGTGTVVAIPPSNAEANPQPTLTQQPAAGTGNYAAPPTVPGSPTGTYVGAKVVALRGDLQRLQDNINHQNSDLQQLRQQMGQDASGYYTLVGGINSRLQIGTTPGNPELINQWNQAQGALDRMSDEIARLNSLSNVVASDSSVAAYLLDSVRAAYSLQGAVDEDHRQLRQLEGDVNGTIPQIDRLLGSLSEDISRQSVYVSNERQSLVALSLAIKNGELYGQGNTVRSLALASPTRTGAIPAAERRPLVVIRFNRPDVAYESALRTAVTQALSRRPAASFDLVAVTPNAGSPAQVEIHAAACKRNAESVLRAMTDMGVSPTRVSLSSTTSASVRSNEVQIYVR
ncbi:MAG TPA: hypothetical protein VLX85_03580 [Stellaceae bacterium]|nr:hypothetical protein [Stellaceae bacterium]